MPHGCLGRNVEVKEEPELHLGGDDGWQLEQRRAGDCPQIEIERRGGERLAAHVREGGGRDPCVGRVELALGGKREDHVGGVEAGRERVGGIAVAACNQNPGATGVRRREQRRNAVRDAVGEAGVDSFEAVSAVARRLERQAGAHERDARAGLDVISDGRCHRCQRLGAAAVIVEPLCSLPARVPLPRRPRRNAGSSCSYRLVLRKYLHPLAAIPAARASIASSI